MVWGTNIVYSNIGPPYCMYMLRGSSKKFRHLEKHSKSQQVLISLNNIFNLKIIPLKLSSRTSQ